LGPLLISATVEARNFKFGMQLGLGLAYQKQRLGPKLAGGLGQGSIQKNWDPLFISATDSKIGTQQVYLAKHKF